MKGRRKVILGAAVLLILISGSMLLWDYMKQSQSEKIYEELASQVEETTETAEEETEAEYVSPINFEELWAINEDVVGWLTIPGTVIDYPILHDPESNDTYLYTDIEGNRTASGSIYLDCDNEGDFSDLHNVLYGHHMRNGTMFKDIMKFREQDFMEEHQEAYIYLPDREIRLRQFSCLYTTSDGIRRMTKFDDEETFQAYVAEMTKGSSAYIQPEQEVERLFSFVTCSYEFDDARTIMYAYEVTEDEDGTGETESEPEVSAADDGAETDTGDGQQAAAGDGQLTDAGDGQ